MVVKMIEVRDCYICNTIYHLIDTTLCPICSSETYLVDTIKGHMNEVQ